MSFYKLFDYDSFDWLEIVEHLNAANLNSLRDIETLISNLGNISDDFEFKSLSSLIHVYDEKELANLFNKIKLFALKLPEFFPFGRIYRLSESNGSVKFKRYEILCLLCHMILCTLKKSKNNFYWVTFENWLMDGRCCAISYLTTLIEYFRQTFEIEHMESNAFMNELIEFERHSIDTETVLSILESRKSELSNVIIKLHGSIGDEPFPEVDFANCDIGYGITGTQEEMLFGASPELCVAMLFCDTLKQNEAILITGARKVSKFKGYGLNINIEKYVSIEEQSWKERKVIAIDALDFSGDFDSSFKKQISIVNLNRELVKAFCGFSFVKNTVISTGHWGCGAFCGHKQLKALIQLIAASISQNNLLYYCYEDNKFFEDFKHFLFKLNEKEISVCHLWNLVLNMQKNSENFTDENIFSFLNNLI